MSSAEYLNEGYLVIEKVFNTSQIDKIREEAMSNYHEIRETLNQKGFELGIGTQNGFKE